MKPQSFRAISRFIEFLPGGNAGSSGGMVSGSDVSVWSPSLWPVRMPWASQDAKRAKSPPPYAEMIVHYEHE